MLPADTAVVIAIFLVTGVIHVDLSTIEIEIFVIMEIIKIKKTTATTITITI